MNKLPWKRIFVVCAIVTGLVIAKSVTTFCRRAYAGYTAPMDWVLADPWFYVGIAALLVGIVSFITWRISRKKATAQ